MLVSLISLLAAASAVSAQSSVAPVTHDNPPGAKYLAVLPRKDGSSLRGYIEGSSGPDSTGVLFKVHFSGLPTTGGPFMYHIHVDRVPQNGNCTATGAHLDPYHVGEEKVCDPAKPETCQTGDLSGKHGKFSTTEFSTEYVDLYSSTSPTDPAFFGNRSFVLHLANKTRIGCGNFYPVVDSHSSTTVPRMEPCSTQGGSSTPVSSGFALPTGTGLPGNSTVKPGVPSATATPPVEFPGAAPKLATGAGALLAAAFAVFAL